MATKKKNGRRPQNKKEVPEEPVRRWQTRHTLILGGVILGVIVLLIGVGWLILHGYLGKINHSDGRREPDTAQTELADTEAEAEPEAVSETLLSEIATDANAASGSAGESSQEEQDAAEQAIDENLRREREAEASVPEITNVLLIGSDTRVSGQAGRSDSMMLLTINRNTETLSLTSLLRDMYVYIPGYGNRRINTAFAMGGEALLKETIEQNFDITIDYYATIDFYAFINAIDAIGGIELDISRDEFWGVNHAISKYNKDLGLPFGDGYLTEYGEGTLLTGKQALGYARNRQFTDGDFSRTAHQRILMRTLYDRVKSAGLSELDALLNAFLPGITTDIPESQMLSWMILERKILNYDLVTAHIPVDGSYRDVFIGGAAVLTLDFDKNIQVLHSIIDGSYQPETAEPAA